MSSTSKLLGLAAGLLLWPAGLPLCAQNSAPAAPPAPPVFQVNTTRHNLPGLGYYTRSVATLGTNQFAFVVPKGYLIRVDEANRVVRAVERADKCAITVRWFATPTNAVEKADQSLKPAAFRELLQQRYASARITEEFSLTAGGTSGPAFDFVWRNEGGLEVLSRIAFIPTPAGVVEFHLLTSAAVKEESFQALNSLMLTFRFGEKGKLELPALLEKL